MICPHCFSQFITLIQYDFGQDKQTGVHDKGEIFKCRECGRVSTPEEVEAEDDRSFHQAMTAACFLARTAEVIAAGITMRMHEAAGLEPRESLALMRAQARLEAKLDLVN